MAPAPDIGAYEYNPITIAGVQVNDGSAQRSEVRSLTVTFSGAVSFAGGNANAAAAFQLTHLQTGNNVALSAAVSTNSQGQTVVTLSFSGLETDPVSASERRRTVAGRRDVFLDGERIGRHRRRPGMGAGRRR